MASDAIFRCFVGHIALLYQSSGETANKIGHLFFPPAGCDPHIDSLSGFDYTQHRHIDNRLSKRHFETGPKISPP
jgi:hypothetical protein